MWLNEGWDVSLDEQVFALNLNMKSVYEIEGLKGAVFQFQLVLES